MKRIEEFRIFYNHSIHPELLRMERKRRRLLRLLAGSVVLLVVITFLGFYIDIIVITLFFVLIIAIYIRYLWQRVQQFILTFKPNIMRLILDFIDDNINYGTFKYSAKKSLPKSVFLASKLFVTPAPLYEGEDYIEGKIGEIPFEMCELNVQEYSKVRNRLKYVFKGVFLHAIFHLSLYGTILIWPRELREHLSIAIKEFTLIGGRNIDRMISDRRFREHFVTFASNDADLDNLLSPQMQRAIVNYRESKDKPIYISFVGKNIYIGVTEYKDILEPNITATNVSFELVKEFFEDVSLIISILEDIYLSN